MRINTENVIFGRTYLFQEYKRTHSTEVEVIYTDNLELDFKVVTAILELSKHKEKPKFDRAKEKRKFNKELEVGYEEYLDSLEEEDDLEL